MRNSTGLWLVVIVVVAILAAYMIWPGNPGLFGRTIEIRPGLDIQGGVRVLLTADSDTQIDAGKMDQARQIVDRRVNALGVVEPLVQVAGNNRIIVELPGIKDSQAAIDTIKQTGLLEFVDFSAVGSCSATMPAAGQYVLTDRQVAQRGSKAPSAAATAQATAAATTAATTEATVVATSAATAEPTSAATSAATTEATSVATEAVAATTAVATTEPTAVATTGATPEATAQATPVAVVPGASKDSPLNNPCTNLPFTTIMTGAGLGSADAAVGGTAQNQYVVNFTLAGNDESNRFAQHTASHIGQPLAIVLDGQVLSAPTIQSALPNGGQITGNFTKQKAQDLALQLRYGALPVSLSVESTEQVGASLGNESIAASIRAGLIGLLVVLLFMLFYYRLPGVAAVLAMLLFAAINFALYKFIPVTLTLPSIIGFVISVATAVDGNILIFERIKEELRAGRVGQKALDLGFERAWPSIRDSNISTIIVALILYFFGGQFGAGAVRGFAVTLILGLITNLFTAVIVTHTLMNLIMRVAGPKLNQTALFGEQQQIKE